MKKKQILSGAAASAFILLFVFFNSCSKQNELLEISDKSVQEKDYSIYYEIASFAQKMAQYEENPLFKSGEFIEIDTAIWLMEGAVNLTYGFPFEEYKEFITGEATIIIQKTQEGLVDMDELAIKYQQLIEEAREDYYSSGYDEKGLYVINLEKFDANNNEVIINIETVTGNKGVDLGPFTPTDHWWYGEWGGGCNGNNQSGSDAAQELANAYPAYNINECTAISNAQLVNVIGGELWLRRPNDVLDNHNDYYAFCVQDNIEPFDYENDLCLVANEMAGYYYYLDYIIMELVPSVGNITPGNIFLNIPYQQGTFIYDNYTNITKYYHIFHLLYGLPYDKPNCEPPIEL